MTSFIKDIIDFVLITDNLNINFDRTLLPNSLGFFFLCLQILAQQEMHPLLKMS